MQNSLTELVGSTQYPVAFATLIAARQNELARELNGLTSKLVGNLPIACDGESGAKHATEVSLTVYVSGTSCLAPETWNASDAAPTSFL